MNNKYKIYEYVLECAINEVLGEKIQKLKIVNDIGQHSIVYLSKLADNTNIVIKITTKRNSYPTEIWVYQELAKHGVPVPSLIFYTEKLKGIDLPCLIISKIRGYSLVSQNIPDRFERAIYGEIGSIFSKIHKVRLDNSFYGFGVFFKNTKDIFYNWHSFILSIHDYIDSTEYLFRNGTINFEQKEKILSLERMIINHHFIKVLNHGDLGPDHIFLEKNKIVGVIDPGNSFAGPAEYDLAYFAVYVNEYQFKYALDEYDEVLNIKYIYIYMIVISVNKAAKAQKIFNYEKAEYFVVVIDNIIRKLSNILNTREKCLESIRDSVNKSV